MEKIEIFDAIVGWDGAAAAQGWEKMSVSELLKLAEAQHEHYYPKIELEGGDLDLIVDACVKYKNSRTENDGYYVRQELREKLGEG